MAITSRPRDRPALVHSQAPRTWSSTSPLTRANARRKVDSSAGPRTAPRTARTSGPASAAHCPIAVNDRDPAITAAIPTASNPASECRRPRLFRGSGTRARRSSRYWLRAAVIGKDVIGGRVSLVAEDGERENFHRSVRALPAAPGHAGHITCRYDIAGHNVNSRLCRVPAGAASPGTWHCWEGSPAWRALVRGRALRVAQYEEHLIRRLRQVVQDCPGAAIIWADIPSPSPRDGGCLPARQQDWQQSRRLGLISDLPLFRFHVTVVTPADG